MLVLKRQAGERLVIGNEVVIEVLSIRGDCVRLGIVAPRETSVHRFEIFAEIQNANRAASHTAVAAPHSALATLAAHLRTPGEEAVEAAAPAAPAVKEESRTTKGHTR